jgi:hypothetical protein
MCTGFIPHNHNILPCASVVMMDPWWNPALENQAIDRVHRIGQKKNVHVHRLCIPDTVEDRILALQAKKQALADGALGEGEVPKLAKLGVSTFLLLPYQHATVDVRFLTCAMFDNNSSKS